MPKSLLKAKNPFNQYIIDDMHEMKMRSLRQGQDKVAFIYQKIIYSIQKYPMPLICEEQVTMLQGVGEKTSLLILRMIKNQYHDFEVNFEKFNEAILTDELAIITEDVEFPNTDSCPPSLLFQEEKQSQINYKNYQIIQKRKDEPPSNFLEGLHKSMKVENKESKSKRPYLPGKESKSGQILMSLNKFQEVENKLFASKKEIKDFCKELCDVDISNWNSIETLEKHQLIQKTVLDNEIKYALTDQGQKLGSKYLMEQQLQHKQKKENINIGEAQIVLLIDNRERFQTVNTRTLLYEKLKSIYNLNCRLAQLPIGDFMWIVQIGDQEYICDYIVERKTLSDLASSILDKRYGQQKYKLKTCGITNLFYLIENSSQGHLVVNRQTLEKAIRGTQIRDNFFIQQTESLEESLRWLAMFTKTVQVPENLVRYSDFVYKNSIKCESLYNLWGSMLRGISGVGMESAKQIANQWKTPIQFYEAVNKDQSKSLQQLMGNCESKKKNVPSNVISVIENLFQHEYYPDN